MITTSIISKQVERNHSIQAISSKCVCLPRKLKLLKAVCNLVQSGMNVMMHSLHRVTSEIPQLQRREANMLTLFQFKWMINVDMSYQMLKLLKVRHSTLLLLDMVPQLKRV